MPRVWPFSERFAAWRRRCAAPDSSRLLSDAAGALVDRRPIDWIALLARVGKSHDRALFENLRLLETLRAAASRDQHDHANPSPARLVRAVVWIASVHTVITVSLVIGCAAAGVAVAHRTPQIMLASAFLASAGILALTTDRDPRRWSLVATFLCTASAFARAALSNLTAPWVDAIEAALRSLWCEAFVPACLWQFALDFPRVKRFTAFDVTARQVMYVAWAFGIAAFVLNGAVTAGALHDEVLAEFLPNHPNNAFWRVFTVAIVPAIGAIFVRARRAPFSERRRVMRFAAALTLGTAPFLTIGMLRTMSPSVDQWFRSAASMERLWLDAITVAALTAVPLLCTAAVVADRPFGVRALFDRSQRSRFAVMSAFGRRDVQRRRQIDERLVAAMERLRAARGVNELRETLAREVRDAIGANAVHVLTADVAGDLTDPVEPTRSLPNETSLLPLLRSASTPSMTIDLSNDGPLSQLLPARDRRWLAMHEVELAAPLKRRDGTIVAVALVGGKRSGFAHSAPDTWLVTTLTTAAAGLWESLEPSASDTDDDAAYECPRCGRVSAMGVLSCCNEIAIAARLPLRLGSNLRIDRRLGSGGMGVVYLARDLALDREVALKTLPTLRPDAIGCLHREARAMARVQHEGLATIHGLEWWRSTPVLVMEYFPRGTLATLLQRGPLSAATTIRLGLVVSETLRSIHARGLLHRDLKPSNIAITEAGLPKLLDFGLATISTAGPSIGSEGRMHNAAGTLAYLAPEAFTGRPPSPSLDLWALAVVLVECVIGANLFDAASSEATRARVLRLDLSPVLSRVAEHDSGLAGILSRALDRHPDARFPTAAALHTALASVSILHSGR
jgi:hypothetical protein